MNAWPPVCEQTNGSALSRAQPNLSRSVSRFRRVVAWPLLGALR